jgi:hypothetical protein
VRAVIYFGFSTEYLRSNTEYHRSLYLLFGNRTAALSHPYCGVIAMVQVYVDRVELLDALKGCLHDLEELKLISPGDLDIIDERRILRHKIAELEKEG